MRGNERHDCPGLVGYLACHRGQPQTVLSVKILTWRGIRSLPRPSGSEETMFSAAVSSFILSRKRSSLLKYAPCPRGARWQSALADRLRVSGGPASSARTTPGSICSGRP